MKGGILKWGGHMKGDGGVGDWGGVARTKNNPISAAARGALEKNRFLFFK